MSANRAESNDSKYVELREVKEGLFGVSPDDIFPFKDEIIRDPSGKIRHRSPLLYYSCLCFVVAAVLGVIGFLIFPRQPDFAFLCSKTDKWNLSRPSRFYNPKVDIHLSTYFSFLNSNYASVNIPSMQLEIFHWGKRIGEVNQMGISFPSQQRQLVLLPVNITNIGVSEAAELFWDSMDKRVHLDFKGSITVEYLKMRISINLEFSKVVPTDGEEIPCPPQNF
eukprot:GILI01015026.1.p1 GENE.GILI01015026.1~~GILI01015026.1.p1  ORF type:complete len:223 (+),score=18.27 GILI01015026.1:106-774(+)